MPAFQTVLGRLNRAFGREQIGELVKERERFRPGGSRLATGLVVRPDMALHRPWLAYLDTLPQSMQDAICAVIWNALGTKPPTEITFAWAPAYDFELTIWHAPDTRATRGGITLLLKSRYPDDPHPVPAKGASRKAPQRGSAKRK
jgi:hypothetical protein